MTEIPESLTRYMQGVRRGQQVIIGCLLVVIVALSGIAVTLYVQNAQANHRYEVQTQRYQNAKHDRKVQHDQLCDLLRLLNRDDARLRSC